jgi:flagellar biosynthesis/type III secretory pathway M-ring protein FliF/YscJ
MLPCIITSFIGTSQPFNCWNQTKSLKSASLVIVLMVLIAAIVGLLMYVNHLDWEKLFHPNLSALILIGRIAN